MANTKSWNPIKSESAFFSRPLSWQGVEHEGFTVPIEWKKIVHQPEEVAEVFKDFNRYLIPPGIISVSLIFYALQFELSAAWAWAFLLGLMPILFNPLIIFVLKDRQIFGVPVRNDWVDVGRTLVSMIAFDIPLFLILKPSAIFCGFMWFVLAMGWFFEPFSFRGRLVILTASSASAILCLSLGSGASVRELCFFLAAKFCLLFWFLAIQYLWVDAVAKRVGQETKILRLEAEGKAYFKNALIGEHAKTISHEMNNLMFVIDLSTKRPEQVDLPAVRTSLEKISNLNRLVLDDLQTQRKKRRVSLGQVLEDFNTLLLKTIKSRGVAFRLEIQEGLEPKSVFFEEFHSSIFFILQNMVKNSLAAIERTNPSKGVIYLAARYLSNPRELVLELGDNGGGISREKVAKLTKGDTSERSVGGHGLGIKFVQNEIEKNGFRWDLNSDGRTSTQNRLYIPANQDPK